MLVVGTRKEFKLKVNIARYITITIIHGKLFRSKEAKRNHTGFLFCFKEKKRKFRKKPPTKPPRRRLQTPRYYRHRGPALLPAHLPPPLPLSSPAHLSLSALGSRLGLELDRLMGPTSLALACPVWDGWASAVDSGSGSVAATGTIPSESVSCPH